MKPSIERLRTSSHHLQQLLGTPYWFPHAPLAVLTGIGGILLLQRDLGGSWLHYFEQVRVGSLDLPPRLLPSLLIGGGMLTMAFGLLLRSRVAWTMALLLLATAVAGALLAPHPGRHGLLIYYLLVLSALLISWRHFDRASIAASTLFAITSVAMLLLYATFGSYYLGAEYKPPITDLSTAFYYSMVTMSTVGYGDITPQTSASKLFTVSIIVLGVAVFATSLTAVIAPLIGNSVRRIVNRENTKVKRENHFVIVGDTALAINTWRELAKRGRAVTRILRSAPEDGELGGVDIVVGDAGSVDVLRQAGAERAEAVLAMLDDDSENAFIVLAVKEIGGPARTVAAVNDANHLSRIRLVQPDVTIAPQVLGGELMAMMLTGESVASDFVMQRVFQGSASAMTGGPPATSEKAD